MCVDKEEAQVNISRRGLEEDIQIEKEAAK
jgi:hypothetical protein